MQRALEMLCIQDDHVIKAHGGTPHLCEHQDVQQGSDPAEGDEGIKSRIFAVSNKREPQVGHLLPQK
jgi:hypothetical protein